MLESIKSYINDSPNISFEDYYRNYIFEVQDQNIEAEVKSVKSSDILSLDKLIAKLHKELLGN